MTGHELEGALAALGSGLLFGLSAGLAPGPLLALVVTQTLRAGARAGVTVAIAPIVTDVPIVGICVLLMGTVRGSTPALGVVTAIGAAFVAYLAWDTARAELPANLGADGSAGAARGSLLRGAIVNAVNPHPWLFWLAVGAPTLLGAWTSGGALGAGSFLAGFYGTLVGSKVGIALVLGRARGRVGGRGYRITMRLLALMLLVFAVGLGREAVSLLLGV